MSTENIESKMWYWGTQSKRWVERQPLGLLRSKIENTIREQNAELLQAARCPGAIVELGAGAENQGYLPDDLRDQIISIDLSHRMLLNNKREGGKIQADIGSPLPLASESSMHTFSALTMRYLTRLEHIQLLREIWRITKWGGSFLLADISGNNSWSHQYSQFEPLELLPVAANLGFGQLAAADQWIDDGNWIITGFEPARPANKAAINILQGRKIWRPQAMKSDPTVEQKYLEKQNTEEIKIVERTPPFPF